MLGEFFSNPVNARIKLGPTRTKLDRQTNFKLVLTKLL